jgi:hypothetical protein
VVFQRNPRARRYILRLRPDGTARVTIPRRGSLSAAKDFVAKHSAWLQRQVERLRTRPLHPAAWRIGSELLFRGEQVRIEAVEANGSGMIRFASESLAVPDLAADLRSAIEQHLWNLASRELPPRLLAYASVHRLPVRRVIVRNQRTRWGSCSIRGTVSLNWRLIQTPPFVRDYICLHELMHFRQMNHSPRFWREVASVCPYFAIAERWLKAHSRLLR